MKYIHERSKWPNFHWNNDVILKKLAHIRYQQGLLLGRMSGIGFEIRKEASLEVLTSDIIKSSEIEGEILDKEQVRSSLARSLGVNIGGIQKTSRNVKGIVDMILDATQNYKKPLTKSRLFNWHNLLFPKEINKMQVITIGKWRTKKSVPMQIVSGYIGREKIHFEAPAANRIKHEIKLFLEWINHNKNIDPLLKAGIAHFWFVTIHPFEDGNGRIARAIADILLARADGMSERFYSMSSSIEKERKEYYKILESSQKGNLDITNWLNWFLDCLERSIKNADKILKKVLHKAKIWQLLSDHPINDRQRKIINLLIGDFEGKLTTSKYAKIAKCSQDTALRDIETLIKYGIMKKNPGSGRSTSYSLL